MAILEGIEPASHVVAVPAGGKVRLVSGGAVVAMLPDDLGGELLSCMADGWRYAGELVKVDDQSARVTLEARRVL